jgi:hypothetical protein
MGGLALSEWSVYWGYMWSWSLLEAIPLFCLEVAVVCALHLARLHQDLRRCAVHAFLEAWEVCEYSASYSGMCDFRCVPVHDMLTCVLLWPFNNFEKEVCSRYLFWYKVVQVVVSKW